MLFLLKLWWYHLGKYYSSGQCLHRWHINWRSRQQMVHLDSYQLNDIGISLGEAMEEAAKPFWKD